MYYAEGISKLYVCLWYLVVTFCLLLITKILPRNLTSGSKAAILSLKMITGSRLFDPISLASNERPTLEKMDQ